MPSQRPGAKKKQEQLADEIKQIRKAHKANLVCADCPNRAPSYVCLNFNTFICTECSGLHRKFNHRVKSIAVATFTEEEVNKLRNGGNEVANAHYLAKYRRGHDTFLIPKEGERDRMEQYLNYKYIERKWYRENLNKNGSLKKKNKKDVEESKSKKVNRDAETTTNTNRRPSSTTHHRTSHKRQNSREISSSDSNDIHPIQPLPITGDTSPIHKATEVVKETDTTKQTQHQTQNQDQNQNQNQNQNQGQSQNWDPWAEDNDTSTNADTSAVQDDWSDFWSNKPSNKTQTSTNGTANTTNSRKNSQNITSLYQNPNPLYGGVPMGMGMPMAIPMNINGNIVWSTVNPAMLPSQLGSQIPVPNTFLGASNQPQQHDEMEKKKLQDGEAQKKETPRQSQKANSEKDEIDPFASLLDNINLNLKLTSNTNQNDAQNHDKPNTNAGSNTFATHNPSYYGAPTMGPSGNPMGQVPPLQVNPYMTGGTMPNTSMYGMPYVIPMGYMYPNANANMYGYFTKAGSQTQPPNAPNSSSNVAPTSGYVDDNPFR